MRTKMGVSHSDTFRSPSCIDCIFPKQKNTKRFYVPARSYNISNRESSKMIRTIVKLCTQCDAKCPCEINSDYPLHYYYDSIWHSNYSILICKTCKYVSTCIRKIHERYCLLCHQTIINEECLSCHGIEYYRRLNEYRVPIARGWINMKLSGPFEKSEHNNNRYSICDECTTILKSEYIRSKSRHKPLSTKELEDYIVEMRIVN